MRCYDDGASLMASTTKHCLKTICAYLDLHAGQLPTTELQLVQKVLVCLISLSAWRTWSWIWNDCINIKVNFNEFIMHSHFIINVPEVEQLDEAGVWVTDACVGGLTVAAILTAQIHKSLLHYCWHRQGKMDRELSRKT